MFEGDQRPHGESFEPAGAPPLPGDSNARGSRPLPPDGSAFPLLSAATILAALGLLALGLCLFAELTAYPALAAFLLGVSFGALLLAVVALLAWWRRRGRRSAPLGRG
jgi:hypothetical protein